MPGLGERSRLLAQQLGNGNHEDNVFRRLDLRRKEEVAAPVDQTGVEIGVGESGAGNQPRQEIDIGGNADDAVIGQRLLHARQRGVAVDIPDDQLGDHRIVV